MILNEYGKIVKEQWLWLKEQYPYVILHDYVVMPNHFHGILEISRQNARMKAIGEELKIKPLSDLVGAFKTEASKKIHLCGFKEFAWHRSFNDQIIRDEGSFLRISAYIRRNPENWRKGDFDIF